MMGSSRDVSPTRRALTRRRVGGTGFEPTRAVPPGATAWNAASRVARDQRGGARTESSVLRPPGPRVPSFVRRVRFVDPQCPSCPCENSRTGPPAPERAAASRVAAPLVEGCLGWLECRVVDRSLAGRMNLFVCETIAAWADDAVFRGGEWRFADAGGRAVHHSAGGRFFVTGEERMARARRG